MDLFPTLWRFSVFLRPLVLVCGAPWSSTVPPIPRKESGKQQQQEQLGKLGEGTKEKYTDLGLVSGKREEQVACHASALALAMTDEARREAEM